jgi:acyl-CoA-binding protein
MSEQLKAQFNKASEEVQDIGARPSNDVLLKLYALYKQATEGDVQGERPGMTDFKGRAKYDAWAAIEGMSAQDAMQDYVDLVESLK